MERWSQLLITQWTDVEAARILATKFHAPEVWTGVRSRFMVLSDPAEDTIAEWADVLRDPQDAPIAAACVWHQITHLITGERNMHLQPLYTILMLPRISRGAGVGWLWFSESHAFRSRKGTASKGGTLEFGRMTVMDIDSLRRVVVKQATEGFAGAVLIRLTGHVVVEQAYGEANRSDGIPNRPDTRFGIASGAKLLTAIAINQLIDAGQLTLDTRLRHCLPFAFPQFDSEITIHHLLTHTAGVPDYFDEDVMENFEDLWVDRPMYGMRRLEDFLPLFQNRAMQYGAGERFQYNNGGYILLGLVVEQVTHQSFADYVMHHVLMPAGMTQSGYFEMDALPARTALGYIHLPDGRWKTNIYSVPAKGGADGGVYVTVKDMAALWDALMAHQLLSPASTKRLLTPHVAARIPGATQEGWQYGYGVWIDEHDGEVAQYFLMGYDPGANFHSAVFPTLGALVVVCSNQTDGASGMMAAIEDEITRVV